MGVGQAVGFASAASAGAGPHGGAAWSLRQRVRPAAMGPPCRRAASVRSVSRRPCGP